MRIIDPVVATAKNSITPLICLVFCLCSNGLLFGQEDAKKEPFILQGQLSNGSGKLIHLVIRAGEGFVFDTVRVGPDGSFYLRTFNIVKPEETVQFRVGKDYFGSLCAAPGYNLTLTANVQDWNTFKNSIKISGIGSAASNYSFLLQRNREDWPHYGEKELLTFVRKDQHFTDSALHVYFDRELPGDKYFAYFKKTMQLGIVFRKLYYLLCMADDSTNWSYQKSVAFVKDNFRNDPVLNNLFREEYMVSSDYKAVIQEEYARYLRSLDCKKGKPDCDNSRYSGQIVEKIGTVYTGTIRDLVLFRRMQDALQNCRTFEELNYEKKVFAVYIPGLADKGHQTTLVNLLESKETELVKTQIGLPAPVFDARDSAGGTHHLEDYKGKVIYLDLWASWCGPCREQTPFLKTLRDKYKDDDRVVFISVAVQDQPDNWKKALLDDKPTWLQLLDTEGKVQQSYVANSIPKFVVISKQFKIVSLDAPSPSQVEQAEKMLGEELAK